MRLEKLPADFSLLGRGLAGVFIYCCGCGLQGHLWANQSQRPEVGLQVRSNRSTLHTLRLHRSKYRKSHVFPS